MNILVTGGAGYIGSHTLVELLEHGHRAVVVDNFCNSSPESLRRVRRITGKAPVLVEGDVRDRRLLRRVFGEHAIAEVVHFAGLKAVGESVRRPLEYYDNNVNGTLVLVEEMRRAGVFKLVFSSSAAVYGEPARMPVHEGMVTGGTTNPYGSSKLMVEQMLQDLARADPRWAIALLRYFNPVGAHESGLIGEDPNGVPNNLLPYMAQVAVGRLGQLAVFGNDYPTADGTGVRDYIHVMDLAAGHLCALERIAGHGGACVYNLGTGRGYSVLQMIAAFERACGRRIPVRLEPRRAGDVAECWADVSRARAELGWQARRSLAQMMADAWRWQSLHPHGYRVEPLPWVAGWGAGGPPA
ncbi:UDP-glucose 4-epimerase GalE [Zobellella endophytica]|uniref:UDP-glucose 4-epimerase n=1 Tax=Zobellella endophytica TaxID=2116700 RepID=A0A2P7R3W9_9GAMM|nr:UDP-glucose 4-epimerase GalE [Zobellella endophytica]PSJ44888.1 UDP-glucose 4-epimerase GalE [Zobellella endophytica]